MLQILLDKDDFKLGLSRDEVADPHMWHEEYEVSRCQGKHSIRACRCAYAVT